jgi:polyketide-type polyunsaturated fatty acid synthase PfaA
MSTRAQKDAIAVVGLGAILPGAVNVSDFFRNLMTRRELIREVPPTYWLPEDFYDPDWRVPDKVYCKKGAFLDPIDFDPMKYGVPPKLLESTDTCQLLALMVADQVLHDALGDRFDHVDRERIGCILGICSGLELVGEMAGRLQRPSYVKVLREHGLPEDEVQKISDAITGLHAVWNESTFPGLLGNVVTGRITNHFDLGGPNFTTDAACASSFAAVAMAANLLRNRDADLVITGGADTANDPFTFMCFSKTPALSMTSVCAPFSERADGTMLGEGLAMVALRRLDDAERDGDRIYAVLRGWGASSDGKAKSIYAPRWEGQVKALRRCYDEAGYGPDTVGMVEAHGTGTKAGDTAEFSALRQVFDESTREDRQWCALGSIKSQMGHTKATAGAVGLMKTVMSLNAKVLPPTFNVDKPGDKLEIDKTAFYLNTEARPWIQEAGKPRRASVSSFGFGGTNFHLTLEEYTGKRARSLRARTLPAELVLLCEQDRAALLKSARDLAASSVKAGALAHIARESQGRFRADARCRLAVVASSEEDLAAKLGQAAEKIEKADGPTIVVPGSVYFSEQAPRSSGVSFLFSGQGSQYVGMGGDVAMAFDASRAVWDEEAAARLGDAPLHDVVFPRPVFTDDDREAASARLRATEWAQPAIGAVSASLLALLRAVGLKPDCVGGHSFGEVSALFAAGVLDRASFLKVARRRGELMAKAAHGAASGMTAVTAPLDKVESLLQGSEAVVANHNDPKQVVVSGTIAAIEDAEKRFAAAGIKTQRLPVAAAFHSPVVAGSVGPFTDALEGVVFQRAVLPVFANATADVYPAEPAAMRAQLGSSIARRVRFVEMVEAMYARGVRTFVEVGPGAVLTSMVGRILGERPHLAVALDRAGNPGTTALWQGLAQIAVAGHPLDLSALWGEYQLAPDPRAEPKPKMLVSISGTNYGKRYPPPGGAAALPPPNPPRAQREEARNGEVMESKDHKASNDTHGANGVATNGGGAMPRAPAIHGSSNGAATTNGASGHAHSPVHEAAAVAGSTLVVARDFTPAWSAAAASDGSWLGAFESIQNRTAEAHALYQQTMAQCHLAFLRTAEQSAMALASLASGGAVPLAVARPALPAPEPLAAIMPMMPAPAVARPRPAPAPAMAYAPAPAAARPARAPAPAPAHAPAPAAAREPVPASAPAPSAPGPRPASDPSVARSPQSVGADGAPAAGGVAAPAPAKPAKAPALPVDGDLKTYLFSIVSEKTGYPADILNLEQQLEADLGIDSIKRVEILSAFEGQIPDIKDVNLEEVTKLNTLGDVLGFMERYADQLGFAKKKE